MLKVFRHKGLYFVFSCRFSPRADTILLYLKRNNFLYIPACSVNQLSIHAHHGFKGWLSSRIPEMEFIELYIVLSVFWPEGWRVRVQPVLYHHNSVGRCQEKLVCKVDEIIFLHLWFGQEVNRPISKWNCFNRPTIRCEKNVPINTVDISFKPIANSCELVNKAMKASFE